MWFWTWIVSYQREIYLGFAEHIKAFANDGSWIAFLSFLPMGIAFGAVHAMTPGHSKALLATYLTGSPSGAWRAIATSTALAITHVSVSVAIVLLSLPLVNIMFGGSGPGSSPILETLSRRLLGAVGLWMVWRGLRGYRHRHEDRHGVLVGMTAGLIPCPLTLFVMNFAVLHDVVPLGFLFAATMMIGIGATLGTVALVAMVFRRQLQSVAESRPMLLSRASRALELLAGLVLVVVAATELVR